MNPFQRSLQAADRFQQRRTVLGFPIAVWSKFNSDQAGNLAALIAYYGFAALFPLLLVLVTVLNIFLANDPGLRAKLLDSALAQYPVIGTQINNNLGHIGGTGLPLAFGIVLLLLGARGVAGAMQNALCEIWGIAKEDRPGFPLSQLWAMALIFTVGIGFILTTSLSGLAQGIGHVVSGTVAFIGAALVSLILNVGVFWLSFRIATVFKVPWRQLLTGAVIAAVCWQALQLAGSYVVGHQLHRASELYGTFGIVLGLLAWLYLQAELTLYAAEVDVVLARRLWPRSVMPEEKDQPDEARQRRDAGARQEARSSLEEQPSQADQAAAGERPPVPSPRDEPPADAKRAAGQR